MFMGWKGVGWKEEGSSIIYIVSRNLNRKLSRIRGIDGGWMKGYPFLEN